MNKTTTLDLNKPAHGDYTGRWDVPLNENADLVDAEVTATRDELTGQTAADISGYLKGSTASLAARINVGLEDSGEIKFNDGDLETSRYSGLEERVSDPYDDIHKRLEAIEGRLFTGDSVNELTGTCANQIKRATSAASGFNWGARGQVASPNMLYTGGLTASVSGNDINISSSGDQEFVIGGKLYVLKNGRTITVQTGGMSKGILYAQGWNGTAAASAGNPAGGQIASGTGSATAASNTLTVASVATGIITEILAGDTLVLTDGSTSVKYRFKVLKENAGDIEIYGKFPRAFTAGTSYVVLRATEPKFNFVDTSALGSICESGFLYGSVNTDRNNSSATQYDRVAVGYCDGSTIVMFPKRTSMGGTEIIVGGNGLALGALSLPAAISIPLTVGASGLSPAVKAVIPIAFGTDSNGDGVIVFNPSMLGLFTNASPSYSRDYSILCPIFAASITYAANEDHTFDGDGTIWLNVMQDATMPVGPGVPTLFANCSNGESLSMFVSTTFWGVAIIY